MKTIEFDYTPTVEKKKVEKPFRSHFSFSRDFVFLSSILILMLVFLLMAIYYQASKSYSFLDKSQSTSTASVLSTDSFVEKIDYYIPVTGFKELKNNISSKDLESANIFVMASKKEIIGKSFPQYKLTAIEDKDFVANIANGKEIALVNWKDLSPRMKVLSIENQLFFDKTLDLTKYPLRTIESVKVNSKEEGAKITAENFEQKSVNRILGMGSMIPARTVDKVMRTKNDYLWPFREVKPFLDKYDAQVSGFEAGIKGQGNGATCALNCFDFIANEKFIEGVKYSGIDLVTLATNHTMNAGLEGMGNNIKLLNEAGVKTTGGSTTNNEDATKPAILDLNGVKYGFIGYNEIPSTSDWATDTKGGTGRISTDNYEYITGRVTKDVKRAKDMGAQFVFVMLHFGAREYTNNPLDHQKELVHHIIDEGADGIIGDHPHWVLPVEFYTPKSGGDPKFIYYSTGNFIFDQDWSVETSQGSFIEFNFYKDKLLSVHIHPHQIYNTQPKLLDENSKEYKQIMDRVFEFTGKL
jgi:poly-gamma-glutamate capsule biosynthesis protein CapA/YwtB (metallophosphatase superfamily)